MEELFKITDKREEKKPRIVFVGTKEDAKKFRAKNFKQEEIPLAVLSVAGEQDEALPMLEPAKVKLPQPERVKLQAKSFADAGVMPKKDAIIPAVEGEQATTEEIEEIESPDPLKTFKKEGKIGELEKISQRIIVQVEGDNESGVVVTIQRSDKDVPVAINLTMENIHVIEKFSAFMIDAFLD